MPLTTQGAGNVLFFFFGTGSDVGPPPNNHWGVFSLHTGDAISGANEVVGTSYQRQALTFDELAASPDELINNTSGPTWTVGAGENWGNVANVALCWDGSVKTETAKVMAYAPVSADMTVPANTLSIPVGGVDVFGTGMFTREFRRLLLDFYVAPYPFNIILPRHYYPLVADPAVQEGVNSRRFLLRLYNTYDPDTSTGTVVAGTGYADVPLVFDSGVQSSGNQRWVQTTDPTQFPVAGAGGWTAAKFGVFINQYWSGAAWTDAGHYAYQILGLPGIGITVAATQQLTLPAGEARVYAA